MRINGTLVNYFVHCQRQWYLHYHRINLENESALVQIGKVLHEQRGNEEVAIEGIQIDKITSQYIVEVKKSDADLEAAKYQLLFYLKKAREKGIVRKGKLECLEKNKKEKQTLIFDYDEYAADLQEVLDAMAQLHAENICPKAEKKAMCKKCAYYKYCFV